MPESPSILFGCPHCQRRLKVNAKAAGRHMACPDCQKQLVVPEASEAVRRTGAFQVFISYSSKDKQWADAARAALEGLGVDCWIAPRDIPPGSEWGAAIIAGIDACKVMVLVFSTHADQSPQVRREVERAIHKGLVIVPLRIENVNPSGAMEYALSNTHWLDASASREDSARALANATRSVLQGGLKPPRVTTKLVPTPDSATRPTPRSRVRWLLLLPVALFLMLIACAGMGAVGWQLFGSARKGVGPDAKEIAAKTPAQKGGDNSEPFEEEFAAALKRADVPRGWVFTEKIGVQPDAKGRASIQVIAKQGEHFAEAYAPGLLDGDFAIEGEFRIAGDGVIKINIEARKGGVPVPVTFRQTPSISPYGFVSIAGNAERPVPNFKYNDTNRFRISRKQKAGQVFVNDGPVAIVYAPLNEAGKFDTIRAGLTAETGWLYKLKVAPPPPKTENGNEKH